MRFECTMAKWRNIYLPAGVGDLATGLADCMWISVSASFSFKRNANSIDNITDETARTVQRDDLSHCVGG